MYFQKAYTLLELFIAMSIGLVLLSISVQVLIHAAKGNRLAQQKIDMLESASVARYFLERDIRRAGFYSGLNESSDISGSESPVIMQANCQGGDESFSKMLFPAVFSINNSRGDFFCLEKYVQNTDVLVLRYLNLVEKPSKKNSDKHKLYMKVDVNEGRLFKAKDENHYKNTIHQSSESPIGLYEVKSYIYYLRDTGRYCDGLPIYALFREYNNGKGYMQAEEMVSGIEQMQFQFLTRNGLKQADEMNMDVWNELYGISVDLLVRSECSEALPERSDRNYQLSDINVHSKGTSNFLREHVHFDVMLRNP